MDLIPGLGRSPGEEKGYPLQYSNLENSMDYIVHGVAKSRTQLNNFHFHLSVLEAWGGEEEILNFFFLNQHLRTIQHQ